MRCPDYANTACFISNRFDQERSRKLNYYYNFFSMVNGENYLFRGCSPFNTDEIFANNRLHDPVCNKWGNDENCKQQCDRDSFCNRGDMKIGKSEVQILNIKKSKKFEILKKKYFSKFYFRIEIFFREIF